MFTGLAELVFLIAVMIVVAKLTTAAIGDAGAGHQARARAMGGRVASPPKAGEVCRYHGTANGIEWTLSVVTVDDAETPRRTTLIWRTGSVRSERVLAVVGNGILAGAVGRRGLDRSGLPLGLDPTGDHRAAIERTTRPAPLVAFAESAHEVTEGLHRVPEGFRVFTEDDAIARRVLTGDVAAAIARWHAAHGGSLRIWVGGPDLRFMTAEIHWPPPEAFRELLNLGLELARAVTAPASGSESPTTPIACT